MSVCADAKTVRDKEGRDKRAPTMQDWVNSVNAGFKVAKLLTEVNVYDFFLWKFRTVQTGSGEFFQGGQTCCCCQV